MSNVWDSVTMVCVPKGFYSSTLLALAFIVRVACLVGSGLAEIYICSCPQWSSHDLVIFNILSLYRLHLHQCPHRLSLGILNLFHGAKT